MDMANNLDMAIYAAVLGMSDEEIAAAALLPEPEPETTGQRTREPRLRTLIRATIVVTPDPAVTGAAAYDARYPAARRALADEGGLTLVRNVSEHGMCLVMRSNVPHRGKSVCVFLPDGKALRGQVRWSDHRACGVELTDTLDVHALIATTQRRNAPISDALDERFEAALRPLPQERPPLRYC
jgi:hypothetical protein